LRLRDSYDIPEDVAAGPLHDLDAAPTRQKILREERTSVGG
jgi:hypothetical protein